MILKKWNYDDHKYHEFVVPDNRRVTLRELDMETVIDCAACGCSLTFGDSYSSQEIHNAIGFGYAVCQSCSISEILRRRMDKEEA